ncbi:UNVERIFIED_CONTAM: hypothetical protein HHA_453700 [Hammondia hammondi]|eukprot:XP_008886949.1 hypothetical protein HHA_453700 [Hammondia hammondi]
MDQENVAFPSDVLADEEEVEARATRRNCGLESVEKLGNQCDSENPRQSILAATKSGVRTPQVHAEFPATELRFAKVCGRGESRIFVQPERCNSGHPSAASFPLRRRRTGLAFSVSCRRKRGRSRRVLQVARARFFNERRDSGRCRRGTQAKREATHRTWAKGVAGKGANAGNVLSNRRAGRYSRKSRRKGQGFFAGKRRLGLREPGCW